MKIYELAIKRPIFITCVFILILTLGFMSLKRLGVDLFPDVNFPVVAVTVTYRGAGPKELETLVTKPIEDQLSTLSGLKNLTSVSEEGVTTITAEFNLGVDVRFAEQKVRNRIGQIRDQLPRDIDEPIINTFDPSDIPIMVLALNAKLPEAQLYDLANNKVRPALEQVDHVGLVRINGGRKREIQVLLNENQLKARELSATQVVSRIAQAGQNTPAGKIDGPNKELLVRSLGDFHSLKAIKNVVVNFLGNEVVTRVGDVASVKDGLQDEKTRTYINGKPALTLMVYRQSSANTVEVAKAIRQKIGKINDLYKGQIPGFHLTMIRDGSKPIRSSIRDVSRTIYFGIFLTILVVLVFLGNIRSTLITGIALPNSLLGAFILMAVAGFTLNVMSLMALSLAVGLLIDDAIVVRENIFRHIELGEDAKTAARRGTQEVVLAVLATTLVVLSVFGPIAFLRGIVGQFFKQFGMTICFAMIISLLDSLTMAPMLSAYFAPNKHTAPEHHSKNRLGSFLNLFGRLQRRLERAYLKLLEWTMRHPLIVIGTAIVIFILSFVALRGVQKTFVPEQETGEFQVTLDMPAGTSLAAMDRTARAIDQKIRSHRQVRLTLLTTGGINDEPNQANIAVLLKSSKLRRYSTSQMKSIIRRDLTAFSFADPKVGDLQAIGGANVPAFAVDITGEHLDQLKTISNQLLALLKRDRDLKDVDTNYRSGQPELQVIPRKRADERLGILSSQMGSELRTLIAGAVPAKFRQSDTEYDIRVRLKPTQRDLRKSFSKLMIPNINNRLIPLPQVARLEQTTGPASIYRRNRARYIEISGNLNPNGKGLAQVIKTVRKIFNSGKIKLPAGVNYQFVGNAQDYQDLTANIFLALILSIAFIYLVLSSLYESFFIPFAIMLVLPLAACGAFYALALAHSSLDIFSMIGCILLLGVATKNSILLVDHIQESIRRGVDLKSAILEAGKVRLRPILMTSFALIAGMIPVAIPLSESAQQRTSMGIAVIGGLISSTLLTLVVVPAAYSYIERFEKWVMRSFHHLLN